MCWAGSESSNCLLPFTCADLHISQMIGSNQPQAPGPLLQRVECWLEDWTRSHRAPHVGRCPEVLHDTGDHLERPQGWVHKVSWTNTRYWGQVARAPL